MNDRRHLTPRSEPPMFKIAFERCGISSVDALGDVSVVDDSLDSGPQSRSCFSLLRPDWAQDGFYICEVDCADPFVAY